MHLRLGRSSLATLSTLAAVRVHDDHDVPLAHHLRAYIVYAMCSAPTLVDNAPDLIRMCSAVPGLAGVTNAFIRLTFFNHFVGGDTAQAAVPLVQTLRAHNRGALLNYSVEASGSASTSQHQAFVQEILHSIDVAADFEDSISRTELAARKTWVAVKLSALLPNAQSLHHLSEYITCTRTLAVDPMPVPFPGMPKASDLDVITRPNAPLLSALSVTDIQDLRGLHANLERICAHAQERGVRVIVDAEYSWYQPAIDALTLSLMRRFNKPSIDNKRGGLQPLVYGTFQAYLRRTPEHLERSLADARAHGYALGVKLVRGAYHPYELAAHRPPHDRGNNHDSPSISFDVHPPVWTKKEETDACYDACVRVLIHAVHDDVSRADTDAKARNNTQGLGIGIFTRLGLRGAVHGAQFGLNMAPRVGVLFGTHNWNSCAVVLDELRSHGLAEFKAVDSDTDGTLQRINSAPVLAIRDDAVDRVAISQLYGMSDELTAHLVASTASRAPFVIKYIPYGALTEVMPYLARRAIENRSMLGEGAAVSERNRAWRAFWEKLTR